MLYIDKTGENNSLVYKCKGCDYKEVDYNKCGCIYTNQHNNVFLTHNITNNPYIKYDNTLPRINTMRCINDECVSNMDYTNVLYLTELNIHSFNWRDRLTKDMSSFAISIVDVDDVSCLIVIKDLSQRSAIESKIREWHPYFKFMEKLTSLVIFIKYDPENLKYVYICNYCNSSWKNT
jgi:hypothetical protein